MFCLGELALLLDRVVLLKSSNLLVLGNLLTILRVDLEVNALGFQDNIMSGMGCRRKFQSILDLDFK